ncbi:helix-turn-helix domain-containing protein [Burkholderia stagnalis]|uniref:helix-turn-helix domain-containing protein n=1 Tax=Burkholderia stagnalis TaxID=1503054 RepID=UPI0009C0D5D4|nr:helix-turn-helix domain-containing protein [Burkholderia stagnalis]MDY7804176.1 helix-turn-helix domain-containing protein [Burkholderia stagnalis]
MNNTVDFSMTDDYPPSANVPALARIHWQIGILLHDHFPLPDVSNVAEVFDLANRLRAPDARPYVLNWLSAQGGTVPSRSGVYMWTERVDECQAGRYDILFVVGDASSTFSVGEATDWQHLLVRRSARHAVYRDSQSLIAVLARPGIDQPSPADATTHALSLVRYTSNAELAARVERQLAAAYPAHHLAALTNTSPRGSTKRIRGIARWIRENCDQSLSISDAAHLASMSERNFQRHFKLEMGMPPSEYLLSARLELACLLLTESDLPVDKVARRVGLACGDRLAKLFRQHLAISPSEYRSAARSRRADACSFIASGKTK